MTAPAGPQDDQSPRLNVSTWRDPRVFIATGFASGFLRPAPGTWGSLAALAVWWLLLSGAAWPVQIAAVVLTAVLGTWLVAAVDRRYGVHDDPAIVVDEFAGLWLALLAAPAGPTWMLAGFVLFRVFDVAKPWPIGWADRRVPGALGVMLDDLFAGVLTAVVLQSAFLLMHWSAAPLSP
ncbi:MAG: phosphatidylglycerophosphatase A [Gammaproteobacteria bacterium]|nr:phosphatidylglycerophosphatase A [Gammaproteobacteria bacterium]